MREKREENSARGCQVLFFFGILYGGGLVGELGDGGELLGECQADDGGVEQGAAAALVTV